MKLLLFILFTLLAVKVYSAPLMVDLDFKVNVTSSTSDYKKRYTKAKQFSNALVVGAMIKSYEVTSTSDQRAVNAIRYNAYAINPILGLGGIAPTCSMAYYAREVDVNNDDSDDKNGYDYDVSISANYMALRFFSLEEIDGNNNVVNTIRFNKISWSIVDSNIDGKEKEAELPKFTIGGSSDNITIQITFIATANYGTVTVNGENTSILPPKGMESIFVADLTNYAYANQDNRLRLVMYTVSGNSNRETNVVAVNPSIKGKKNSYVKCVLNGIQANIRFDQKISVKGSSSSDINLSMALDSNLNNVFEGVDALIQINSIFAGSSQMTRTEIPFSSGLKGVVVYDPAMTFGTDPANDPGSSSTSAAAALIVSVFVVVILALINF